MGSSVGELQAGELTIGPPLLKELEKLNGTAAIGRGLDGARLSGLSLVVVVAGGAVGPAEGPHGTQALLDDRCHPGLLGVMGDLDGSRSVLQGVADDVGQVGGELF